VSVSLKLSGREIEAANFKNTYARLKKLYEEIE